MHLDWVCSGACLGLLLLGVCRGILHEGLIRVGAPDVAPPRIKSMLQPAEMILRVKYRERESQKEQAPLSDSQGVRLRVVSRSSGAGSRGLD
ncbi:hypothetical protein BHE74_00032084 [Ensete ventricosum]|nr:hypothetical protein BHE74_00032084 [Ensete ventricosum]